MDVFDLSAKITVDTKDYENNLKDAEQKTESTSSKFSKLGSGLKTAAKIGGAAVVAAGTAVGAMVKKSVQGYAEYEQMVGGVQKLYGNMGKSLRQYTEDMLAANAKAYSKMSSDEQVKYVNDIKKEWKSLEQAQNLVIKNSQKAYKTAGMDANTYLDNATSFSATLINDLGGDTVKAAKQTDVAMRAISDNWNTFGGDLEGITDAFKGFSKQNYTMLDNLKLGYGGTKEEMARLIADANEYGKTIGRTKELTMGSFSDIVTAIELVQEKQNIAGTTAREATTTISGSFGMLKAAWQNLVTGFGDKNADLGKLIKNVVKSARTAFKNLMPVIENALSGITELIDKIGPILAKKLPPMISKLAPKLLSAGVDIVVSLVQGISNAVPDLAGAAIEIITELVGTLSTLLPQLAQTGYDVVIQLLQGITEAMPDIIDGMVDLVLNLVQVIVDNGPKLLTAMANAFVALAQGIIKAIPQIISALPKLITALVNGILNAIPQIIQAGIDLLTELVGNMPAIISAIVSALPELITGIVNGILDHIGDIIDAGIDLLTALIEDVPTIIENIVGAIPDIIDGIVEALLSGEMLEKIFEAGKKIFKKLVAGILKLVTTLPDRLWKIITGIWKALKKGWEKIKEAGKKLFGALWEGMKWVWKQIKEWCSEIADWLVEHFFDIIKTIANLIPGMSANVKTLEESFQRIRDNQKKIEDFANSHKVVREGNGYTYVRATAQRVTQLQTVDIVTPQQNDNSAVIDKLDSLENTIKQAAKAGSTIMLDNRELGRAVRRYA